jgi:hypothetical protein
LLVSQGKEQDGHGRFAPGKIAKRRRVPQKPWGAISVTAKAIIGSYDYRLVALSILIAVFASFAALDGSD